MPTKQHCRRSPIRFTTIIITLCHPLLIRGDPYKMEIRQLKSAIAYGKPEKLSVVRFCITLLNVVTGAPYISKPQTLPKMPTAKRKKLFIISLLSKQKIMCLLNEEKKKKAMPLGEEVAVFFYV
jgi:hypothetical protein